VNAYSLLKTTKLTQSNQTLTQINQVLTQIKRARYARDTGTTKRSRADYLHNTTTHVADVAAPQTESASQNHRKAVHESAVSGKTCDKLRQ
jgi:hypothetical protein